MTFTTRRRLVSLLEYCGVRKISNALCRAFSDHPLPPRNAGPHEHSWSEQRLRTTSETARYYAWANGLRGLLYIPLLKPLSESESPVLPLAQALICVHAMCLLVELHRLNLLRSLTPSAHPIKPPPKIRTGELKYSRWFEPKKWETLERYRAIGLEKFRQIVREYDKKTRGAEPALADNLTVMELDSRVAESMHWMGVILNTPFFLTLLAVNSRLVWLSGAILFLDFYLVGLQRYHRVRIRTTGAKRYRRGPQPGGEPDASGTSTGRA